MSQVNPLLCHNQIIAVTLVATTHSFRLLTISLKLKDMLATTKNVCYMQGTGRLNVASCQMSERRVQFRCYQNHLRLLCVCLN